MRGQRAAVRENLAVGGFVLVQNHDQPRTLDDLVNVECIGFGQASREAARLRVVFLVILLALLEERFGPGLEGRIFLRQNILAIRVDKPDT